MLVLIAAHPFFFGAEVDVGQAYQLIEQPDFSLAHIAVAHGIEEIVDDPDHAAMLPVDPGDAEFQVLGKGERFHGQMVASQESGRQAYPVRGRNVRSPGEEKMYE